MAVPATPCVVAQLLALCKGRMESMFNHGTGWIRLNLLFLHVD